MTIQLADSSDFPAITSILERHGLPVEGLREHLGTTLVAIDGRKVSGSAALEVYSDGALLRSVAVVPESQNRGVGRALIEAAVALAQSQDVPALYLLTTTAEHYFPRFGFERTERSQVPPGVRSSIEFKSACPASATVMRRSL